MAEAGAVVADISEQSNPLLSNITPMTSNERGRHSELLVQTALLANGFIVLESAVPEAFDLAIKRRGESVTNYVQVKTAMMRDEERYGGKNIIVRGIKNNGQVYTRDEVDYFAAVWDGRVYMFPNREISEYWVKLDNIANKWTELKGFGVGTCLRCE